MDADVELQSWRTQWKTSASVVPDLKARVERETRIMQWILAGEVLVTVVIGGSTLGWAVVSRRTDAIVLTIGTWNFIAIAWVMSFLLRRDARAPAAMSTAAFLDLSIIRCRRRREAVAAQALLYSAILTFDLVWIYLAGHERPGVVPFLTSGPIAWLWPLTAVLGVLALKKRRRLARELESLFRLHADLSH